MRIVTGIMMTATCFGLLACQTTTEGLAEASFVPKCENPNDERDEFLARMLSQGNSPEVIERVRAGYIKRGATPEESGSYLSFIELLTGKPNPNGPNETANYKNCFDRFGD